MRKFEFVYRVGVYGSSERIHLWLPVAHDDPYQRVTSVTIESPAPYTVHDDTHHGNRMIYMHLPPDLESRTIEMRFQVERSERRSPVPTDDPYVTDVGTTPAAPFLDANVRVPTDGRFAAIARSIASPDESPLARARKIFEYLLENIEYDDRGCTYDRNTELGDLVEALETRRGTCTEFHGFFASYARVLGLPTRLSFGFNIPRDRTAGTIDGYHCWAEVYLPDVEWFPVDVSEAYKCKSQEARDYFFGHLDENRIQFTSGRDLYLIPRQRGGPVDRFIFPFAQFDDGTGDELPLFPTFEFTELTS